MMDDHPQCELTSQKKNVCPPPKPRQGPSTAPPNHGGRPIEFGPPVTCQSCQKWNEISEPSQQHSKVPSYALLCLVDVSAGLQEIGFGKFCRVLGKQQERHLDMAGSWTPFISQAVTHFLWVDFHAENPRGPLPHTGLPSRLPNKQ